MSDLKISQLNGGASLVGDEYIPLTQKNPITNKLQTVYVTPSTLADYVIKVLSTVDNTKNQLMPVGAIIPFAGAVTNVNQLPGGWLFCDGSNQSKSQFPALFNVLGTTYGVGNDITTFRLPDLRGKVITGFNTTASSWVPPFGNWPITQSLTMGLTGGEYNHQLTLDESPSHSHNLTDPSHTHVYAGDDMWPAAGQLSQYGITPANGNIGYDAKSVSGGATLWNTAPSSTGISIENTGGNLYHNNMPPYIVMNYIIKY